MRTLWGWWACFMNPVRKWELRGSGAQRNARVFGCVSVLVHCAVKN